MTRKGTALIGLGLVNVVAGVIALSINPDPVPSWVPVLFAALWGGSIGAAIDYFRSPK